MTPTASMAEPRFEANPDSIWPALPPAGTATPMSVLRLLEHSERLPTARIRELQFAQLNALVRRAAFHTPFHRERLAAAGIRADREFGPEEWKRIPLLTKDDVRQCSEQLKNMELHERHGRLGRLHTSGSTGKPVTVISTGTTRVLWKAFVLREHFWQQRDAGGKFGAIRYLRRYKNAGAVRRTLPDWGRPLNRLLRTGPGVFLNIRTPITEQLEWLREEQPHYLNTYPSNAHELALESLRRGIRVRSLREILLFGETVSDEIRDACRRAWDARVTDCYTANETGYIALQCPGRDHYHVQAENVYVEILDERDHPCPEGAVGRVVVTPLHNFASPLIRYEIGDYAEAGGPCPCGRGLPVLRRVVGRTRNMLVLPNGDRYWPQVGSSTLRKIAPVLQQQFIQRTVEDIEVRLVMERPATAEEEDRMRAKIQEKLHYPFRVTFSYVDAIERSPTLKFEEFKSLIGNAS